MTGLYTKRKQNKKAIHFINKTPPSLHRVLVPPTISYLHLPNNDILLQRLVLNLCFLWIFTASFYVYYIYIYYFIYHILGKSILYMFCSFWLIWFNIIFTRSIHIDEHCMILSLFSAIAIYSVYVPWFLNLAISSWKPGMFLSFGNC